MPTKSPINLPVGTPLASMLRHELIEHLPVGVYLCDATGTLVAFNRKAADIWGEAPDLAQAEIKFSGAYKLLNADGELIPHDQTPMANILFTRKAVTNAHTIVERRDGSRVPLLANIVPLFDSAGTMIGYMNTVQDLRQQAQDENSLKNLLAALFQPQKVEVVGQITSGVAHEFNNQLASLSMGLTLMQKEIEVAGSEKLNNYYEICAEALGRATDLAKNLLRFSRNRPQKLERIDPNQMLMSIASLIGSAIGSKITVDIRPHPEARFIKADRQQLESALLNLVINARESMPHGGKLTLSTYNAELDHTNFARHNANFQPGSYVVISVADSGCGMTYDQLDKIFAPFYTTKTAGKSTGLGLSTVRGFVGDMNGQLTAESEPGKGSCFRLYFPCYGSAHSMAIDGSDL